MTLRSAAVLISVLLTVTPQGQQPAFRTGTEPVRIAIATIRYRRVVVIPGS